MHPVNANYQAFLTWEDIGALWAACSNHTAPTIAKEGSAHEQDALLEVLGHAQRKRALVQGLAVVDDLDVAPAGQVSSLNTVFTGATFTTRWHSCLSCIESEPCLYTSCLIASTADGSN